MTKPKQKTPEQIKTIEEFLNETRPDFATKPARDYEKYLRKMLNIEKKYVKKGE